MKHAQSWPDLIAHSKGNEGKGDRVNLLAFFLILSSRIVHITTTEFRLKARQIYLDILLYTAFWKRHLSSTYNRLYP